MNIKDILAQNNLAIQEESYTCGPVSLLNILRLKGDFSHSELELAKLCNSRPETGTSHEDLVKAADEVGVKLVNQKEKAAIKDIERNIDDGAYVIVNYLNAFTGNGHYAVVTEYDSQALYLRDCFYGFFRMDKKIFKKFWRSKDGIPQWYAAFK